MLKRLSDLLLIFILFIPVSLFILVLSFLTILINHFPPFFTSKRVGRNGKEFICYKLQCLTPPKSVNVIGNSQADKRRMTKLGEIYRDHGWDELPQLFNILKGEMSFIGPRPIIFKIYEELRQRFPSKRNTIDKWQKKRLKYLPGLSGWHQIHLNDHNIIKYDYEYFDSWTFGKSIEVLLVSTLIFIVGKKRYYSPSIPSEIYRYKI